MALTSESVPVFAHNQIPSPEKSEPIGEATPIEALWLVHHGFAEWRRNWKVIQLRNKPFDRSGLSCKPNLRVMEAAAEGKAWAIAIAEGWQFKAPALGASREWLDSSPAWI